MKRRALALALFTGLLLPGLVPGTALAIATPTYLDQSNTTISSNVSGEQAQTFTAGQSGPLSRVDLWLASLTNPGGDSLSVSIFPTDGTGKPVTTGTALATSGSAAVPYSATTGSWISFSFASPYSVTAGTMYAIAFTTNGGIAVFAWGSDSDAYAGGAAWVANPSWSHQTSPVDFAFRTYLQDSITTTVVWDKAQVAAGTGTALKLTVTIAFGNGAEANNYIVLLGTLPSWYVNPTPPSIVCSWGACTLATIQGVSGVTVPASNPGSTLTVTLQGTANPVIADEGTPGTALGNGCIVVSATSICSDATGSVAVGSGPGPTGPATPPPTSASTVPASDDNGMIRLLPFALLASIGGLLVLVDQKRRRGI